MVYAHRRVVRAGLRRLAATAAGTMFAAGCAGTGGAQDTVAGSVAPREQPAAAACNVTVAAAGDMNDHSAARATGALAQRSGPDVVAALGDLQYPDGSLADFRTGYDRTGWGRLKAKTRPAPGNHEYHTPGASGYFAYFGHPPRYYGYSLRCGWRGYALNSEVSINEQAGWLRRDLAAHPGVSVLAYWHKPRYSSGVQHGNDSAMQPLVSALAGRRGIILNGHEHNYERFAPRGGFRQFVVGTGGSSTYDFGHPEAGSVKRITDVPGVLVLRLSSAGAYGWTFRDRSGATRDAGRG